ncbi:hypothetical protein [Acidianus sp. RZ1]|uniref:tRNA(Phe) 7-((3-amino-3-carboxypropyl)-4-demethylwyosine(37)-N(4))- methyltransferase n=1 Tax=Acidianus sp. RZ1 TaxID=1540082 RepID=UPI0014920C37|nr:hypothetical protein [Acidianus sp. RZ1]NON62795.1 hypothetical protein [Acidianus sp. RZ1]
MLWEEWKRKAFERLNKDREIGYLDPDIYDILVQFFKREKSYTYSSCSGRITIVDSQLPWKRENSTIIFKNHFKISPDEIVDVLSKGQLYRLWLISQGPIFHVYSKDWDETWEVIRIARKAGFKHSGIMSINQKGILIELRTGVKFVHLLREKEDQFLSEAEINSLALIANEVLSKGKEKLNELMLELSKGNDSMELRKDSKGKPEVHYGFS